jgi:dTDP-4-dehydrorhamnose reductase
MRVLVTGSQGQLGQELKKLSVSFPAIEFIFFSKEHWNICDNDFSEYLLSQWKPDYLINTAAYTKVDQAEKEIELCYSINKIAPENLAKLCLKLNTRLIQISTDYVFNLSIELPAIESTIKNPIGVYATSKSEAEDAILIANPNSLILRTSWLYSSYGHNFVKTMYKLGRQGRSLKIVCDQTGNPTYAKNLAECLIAMIQQITNGLDTKGIFHYSNNGYCNWYEFAAEIFRYLNIDVPLSKITTAEYGAPAWRPHFSSLNCDKIQEVFHLKIPDWKNSLHECLDLLQTTD